MQLHNNPHFINLWPWSFAEQEAWIVLKRHCNGSSQELLIVCIKSLACAFDRFVERMPFNRRMNVADFVGPMYSPITDYQALFGDLVKFYPENHLLDRFPFTPIYLFHISITILHILSCRIISIF